MDLHANPGDELVVESLTLGIPPREGEILEVLDSGEHTHYRVRWDDGHESVFFPASTTHAVRFGKRKQP
jgi:hypothetical protein